MDIINNVSMKTLKCLLQCHSTPGDEDEVAAILLKTWRDNGLETGVLGRYAIWARYREHSGKPVLLVCAHMDSPGYAVDRFGDGWIGVTPLGDAKFDGESTPVRVKHSSGETRCMLWRVVDGLKEGSDDFRLSEGVHADHGDRVCFDVEPMLDKKVLDAPFLDNRVGCWVTCEVSARISEWDSEYDVVVAATALEELRGFGADVLASHIGADAVVVVDATYESEEQRVLLDHGPTLTLSDNSVVVGMRTRDAMLAYFREAGVKLQTEVYNYCGTDSGSFPRQGLKAPVAAILIPSRGNHSPHEYVDICDITETVKAVQLLASGWPNSSFSV